MKNNSDRDWKAAAERCLTAALVKAESLADTASDFKSLESLIKTVSDVVGFGAYKRRGSDTGGGGGDDD